MATTPTATPTATAPHDVPAKPKPVNAHMLLLLLVTDWLVGDKHHYAAIRKAVMAQLHEAGADGAEALARLEGMASGTVAPATPEPTKST